MAKGGVVALSVAHDKRGKRDASRAFIPEAKRFLAYWESEGLRTHLALINNRARVATRRKQVIDALGGAGSLKHLAIFAHGWRTGIQMGFRLGHLAALGRKIAEHTVDDAPVVTLYTCSTAQGSGSGGDGGFADELRDALCREGMIECRVDGHVTKGHTTRNPHVRRFEGEGSPFGEIGGRYIVKPRGRLWWPWKQALRGPDDTFRYAYGRMSIADIHNEISGFV